MYYSIVYFCVKILIPCCKSFEELGVCKLCSPHTHTHIETIYKWHRYLLSVEPLPDTEQQFSFMLWWIKSLNQSRVTVKLSHTHTHPYTHISKRCQSVNFKLPLCPQFNYHFEALALQLSRSWVFGKGGAGEDRHCYISILIRSGQEPKDMLW